MLESLIVLVSPLILNSLVALAKWTQGVQSTAGKRFVLAVFSFLGVIAFGALTGDPIDWNSVSSLVTTAVESGVAFLMGHGAYDLWKRLSGWLSGGMAGDLDA